MEVENVSESSLSNVKLSRLEKKKMKKQRKLQDFENGNAESKKNEISLGTDSNLESKANFSLDSATEQLARSRRKKKRKENSLIDEKQNDSFKSKVNVSLESGLKEDTNSLMKDSLSGRDSNVETLENMGLESGLKGSRWNEQPDISERKPKRKKKRKEGSESVVELRDRKENYLIDEKQSDSHLESGLKGVQLNERPVDSERKRKSTKEHKRVKAGQFEELDNTSVLGLRDRTGNSLMGEKQSYSCMESKVNDSLESGLKEGVNSLMKGTLLEIDSHVETLENNSLESGLKEDANSLMKDALSGRDSNVETLENMGLESGLKGSRLNEQPDISERKPKRKKKHKEGSESVVELRDRKENYLIDEKQSDSHLESGLKGVQLNERPVDSERKRKSTKEHKRVKAGQFEELDNTSVLGLRDRTGNSLMGEKQSYSCMESKVNDSLESGLKEGVNSLMKGTLLEIDSHVETLENNSLESGLKGSQLNEQPADSERKRKRKRKRKMAKAGQLNAKSVLELRDREENSLIDEKQSFLLVESKVSVNLESGLKEGPNYDVETLESISLASGLKESQLNEQTVQSKRKIKREKRKKKRLSVLEDNHNYINSKREKRKKYPDQNDVEIETKTEEIIPSLSNLAVAKDDVALMASVKENNLSQTLYSSLERICISHPKKKLLVLDLNGILVDVVQNPGNCQPDIRVAGKGVFRRPFCDDFLNFCFRTFNVGIWSSRINKNVDKLVSFLMRKWSHNLLFCWDRNQCTITKFKTLEDVQKPLVLKELRKLWEKQLPNLPWEKGEYDESNTLLLDDSPYKALRNPANTAVFPYPYQYKDARDSSLAFGGDIRKYLEGLAAAENVQKYVEQNPFGQPAITESNPHWDFYRQIIDDKT